MKLQVARVLKIDHPPITAVVEGIVVVPCKPSYVPYTRKMHVCQRTERDLVVRKLTEVRHLDHAIDASTPQECDRVDLNFLIALMGCTVIKLQVQPLLQQFFNAAHELEEALGAARIGLLGDRLVLWRLLVSVEGEGK
jgi:hypothetical protein